MNYTKVKICGITNCNDAINASNAGADAIGYVFYKDSPRFCSIEQAIQINQTLPPFITKVGLFVNSEAEFVRSVICENVIDIIQFHGSETPEFCSSFKFPFIKVISVKKDTNIEKICDDFVDASAILLDTFDTDYFGGSGKSFDWSLIPRNLKPRPSKNINLPKYLPHIAAEISSLTNYSIGEIATETYNNAMKFFNLT